MTEPDVTLTDYGLAIECAVLVVLLYRRATVQPRLRTWFALFFSSIGVAALAGGTVHGFFLDIRTAGRAVLWPATILALGGAALSTWAIGARIQFSVRLARHITLCATLVFAVYCVLVLFVTQSFSLAIGHYLPGVVFLMVAFLLAYQRTRARPVCLALVGLLLTLVASGLQQSRVGFHPIYFNHNALYHLLEAVALYLIFRGARWFLAVPNPGEE
ncbi:MAG: DUF6962 family protein [Nitrospiraceae bacterium]